MLLPDKALFLYMYVRKEAVLSSQIEGTQSTLDDLLQYANAALAGKPLDDVTEVSNYVDAMMYGLGVIWDPNGLPLCLRLLRDMHTRLLQKGRGEAKNPGEFRRSQNWLGGTRPGNALYVPPPVNEMDVCLGDLERFLHDDSEFIPPLIKAGYLHVQFESILLPALSDGTVANVASAVLYGGTFVGIVSLTLSIIGRCFPANPPLRQNSCRLDKIVNSGAMMRERRGAIRTGIQG
jgi:hypothetical protein